jgi:hypothetical protein
MSHCAQIPAFALKRDFAKGRLRRDSAAEGLCQGTRLRRGTPAEEAASQK